LNRDLAQLGVFVGLFLLAALGFLWYFLRSILG
jgi:hypothetical protein